jgi:hypothetical protein
MSGLGTILRQDPNTMPRIEHMWAYLSVDADGNEGVIAAYFPDQQAWMPLVAVDDDRIKSLRPWAMLSVQAGYEVKLAKFSVREDVETLA